MSFQAYLDAIEVKTGRTPAALVSAAHERGYGSETRTAEIVQWLKDDFELGRGHAMALVHVIKNGPGISDKHVGSTGAHRDSSAVLFLNGKGHPERDAI